MNPQLIWAVAQAHQEDLLRDAREARRAAALRAKPTFAARLIRSILSSGGEPRPATERPRVKPVEIDA